VPLTDITPPTLAPFLEDLARQLDSWLDASTTALSDPYSTVVWAEQPAAFQIVAQAIDTPLRQQALRAALSEILRGQIHSLLVTFDGGTALAETTTLPILDNRSRSFPTNLHELFISHLGDTGRIPSPPRES
jgi:hypothetical protein